MSAAFNISFQLVHLPLACRQVVNATRAIACIAGPFSPCPPNIHFCRVSIASSSDKAASPSWGYPGVAKSQSSKTTKGSGGSKPIEAVVRFLGQHDFVVSASAHRIWFRISSSSSDDEQFGFIN